MSMTSKHFERAAKIVRELRYDDSQGPRLADWEKGYNAALNDMAVNLKNWFTEENSNFDKDRFINACGVRS